MSTVRFGLIGLGIHGMRYAHHLMNDIDQAELYAVCRRDPARGEAFAQQHNVRYYREYLDLLNDPHLDAVAVVTPPHLHEHICSTALMAALSSSEPGIPSSTTTLRIRPSSLTSTLSMTVPCSPRLSAPAG